MSEMRVPPGGVLLEAAATAFRQRDVTGRILPSPDWFDLSEDEREVLFDLQQESRLLECAIHPHGLSGTVREVLRRIPFVDQLPSE
jgi:hypothetical protein